MSRKYKLRDHDFSLRKDLVGNNKLQQKETKDKKEVFAKILFYFPVHVLSALQADHVIDFCGNV